MAACITLLIDTISKKVPLYMVLMFAQNLDIDESVVFVARVSCVCCSPSCKIIPRILMLIKVLFPLPFPTFSMYTRRKFTGEFKHYVLGFG